MPDPALEIEQLFAELSASMAFARRPEAIPGDLRLNWRLSALSLILDRARGRTLKLEHLHVLWWGMKNAETRSQFLRRLGGESSPTEMLVRYDPTLSLTVDLGLGAAVVERTTSGAIKLLPAGVHLAAVATETGALEVQRVFLERLPAHFTQSLLNEMMDWS